MMKTFSLLLVLILALSGCAATDTTRFYLLTPESKPVFPAGDAEQTPTTVLVGAIRFPEYLNRSQIVTRLTENEVDMGWSDRWAEPLERNFTHVLAQNLEGLIRCRCISAQTSKAPPGLTYRIEVDVVTMDGILGKKAVLDVWWSISSPEKKPLLTRRSTFTQPVKGSGYEPFVQAHSRALLDLSREIAAAIGELAKKEGRQVSMGAAKE